MAEKNGEPQNNPLLRIKNQWELLLPIAACVMATIGSFWVPPPPSLSAGGNENMLAFARFVLAVVLALMIVPMLKFSRKKDMVRWTILAAVALTAGIAAFFSYQYLQSRWTVRHEGQTYYIGSVVREEVSDYVAEHENSPRSVLLEDAGWNPAWIWTEESIERNRFLLAAVYILCIPLFALCIMSVAQIMYCATKVRTAPKKTSQSLPPQPR